MSFHHNPKELNPKSPNSIHGILIFEFGFQRSKVKVTWLESVLATFCAISKKYCTFGAICLLTYLLNIATDGVDTWAV